jgi:hypothetical protein
MLSHNDHFFLYISCKYYTLKIKYNYNIYICCFWNPTTWDTWFSSVPHSLLNFIISFGTMYWFCIHTFRSPPLDLCKWCVIISFSHFIIIELMLQLPSHIFTTSFQFKLNFLILEEIAILCILVSYQILMLGYVLYHFLYMTEFDNSSCDAFYCI